MRDKIRFRLPDKNQLGFTLVEILVVVVISSFIMLTSTTLFVSFITTNRKTKIQQRVKVDGNNALNHIEYLIRNAKVVNTCPITNGISIEFEDLQANIYAITTDFNADPDIGDRIIITKNGVDTIHVTGSKNEVRDLFFSCYQGSNDVQYVDISFRIERDLGSSEQTDRVNANFQTGVTVRNLIYVH